MNSKYFFYGFFSVFGLFTINEIKQKKQTTNDRLSSYWAKVGYTVNKVCNEQKPTTK